jgi:RNA polymerase sigma factor (TIGR02999 family)
VSDVGSLTQLLQRWQAGDGAAFGEVFQRAYQDLHAIAVRRLQRAGQGMTISPTEVLHEAYLRVASGAIDWQNRAHFFASMSMYIRSVLVDYARAKLTQKRGEAELRLNISLVNAGAPDIAADLVALDQALVQLTALDPRCAEVLHLDCFGGLDRAQIAAVLQVSIPTIDRDLRFARAWVKEQLSLR